MIRVLIVDDHPIIRKGIRDFLANAPDIQISGETGSGKAALHMSRELSPDVLLLDMELEEMTGVQVALELQKEGSNTRILALSAYNDPVYVTELLKSGAAGYLCKDELPEFILAAVRGVANGESGWLSRQIIAKISNWGNEPSSSDPNITPRETQVLELVEDGKTNQEIGFLLSITPKTVEKHMAAIFRKLNITSRTEAAVWAARKGLRKTNRSTLRVNQELNNAENYLSSTPTFRVDQAN